MTNRNNDVVTYSDNVVDCMSIAERKKRAMSISHTLVRFSKKAGKCDKVLETHVGKAQLVMWALQNTASSKKCFVFETDSKQITDIITGSPSGFPDIERDVYEQNLVVDMETAK